MQSCTILILSSQLCTLPSAHPRPRRGSIRIRRVDVDNAVGRDRGTSSSSRIVAAHGREWRGHGVEGWPPEAVHGGHHGCRRLVLLVELDRAHLQRRVDGGGVGISGIPPRVPPNTPAVPAHGEGQRYVSSQGVQADRAHAVGHKAWGWGGGKARTVQTGSRTCRWPQGVGWGGKDGVNPQTVYSQTTVQDTKG